MTVALKFFKWLKSKMKLKFLTVVLRVRTGSLSVPADQGDRERVTPASCKKWLKALPFYQHVFYATCLLCLVYSSLVGTVWLMLCWCSVRPPKQMSFSMYICKGFWYVTVGVVFMHSMEVMFNQSKQVACTIFVKIYIYISCIQISDCIKLILF